MRKLDDMIKGGLRRLSFRCISTTKLRAICLLSVILPAFLPANAQLNVAASSNAQTLAQSLAGPGVVITNCTRTGDPNSSGTFTNANTNLGLSAGVILSTGKVQNIPQAASNFASSSFSGSGDAQLQTLTTGYIYDKSVLEFDITPQGNVLQFNYVFASEEYPEWVCTQFNDVFGFFITGPNPGGGNYSSNNIANIGNTTLPVSINTINQGTPGAYGTQANCQSLSYSGLFRNNLYPSVNNDIVFDGMTVPLTVTVSVVPCQTYHLKLAVADVSDRIYDSGVLLEANSFSSSSIAISAESQLDSAGFNDAYEGCVSANFKFSLPAPAQNDVTANIQVSGTATNGVDYPAIPATITIPAGQTSTTLSVLPYEDHIAEAPESIIISTVAPCSGQTLSSATMMIRDDIPASVTPSQTTSCLGQPVQLQASGGAFYTWTPANGLNNANIANPVATPQSTTTYTANISFGSCNKTGTANVVVGGPSVSIAASPSLTNCNGGNVQLTANGGNAYQWSGGAGSAQSITVFASGTYTVTVSDNSGCSSTASTNVQISNLSLGAPTVHPTCAGTANGSVDINVNGNSGPYVYHWSNAAQTEDISNLSSGSYTVTVSNNAGCSASATYNVTQSASSVTATAVTAAPACQGSNNGSIHLNVSGGNTPYTYLWNTGSTNAQLNNIGAGSYSYTVTDASGCGVSNSVNLTAPSSVSVSSVHTNVNCNGGNNGAIQLSVSGGNTPYSYTWNDNNNNQNRTLLTAGTYSVTVTDANGCSAGNSSTLTQPAAINVSLTTANSGCAGATGTATVTAGNGNAPYTYAWSNNSGNAANINNVAPGNIICTVTDASGCSVSAQASVGLNNTLNADFSYTGNFCGPVTTIDYTPVDSISGSSYWAFGNGGTSTAQADPPSTYNAPGTYTVIHVITSGYCTDTVSKTVTIYPQPQINATVNNISCNNANTGSINLNVNSGSSPYAYLWNDNSPLQNRTNLAAGNYSVTVTDQHSCSASFTGNIAQTAGLNIAETHSNITCNGSNNGTVQLSVNGGVSPYQYNWSSGQTTQNISALHTGNYLVTVSDVNSCSALLSVQITEPAAVNVTETHNDVTCNNAGNGNIQLAVSGGTAPYGYTWSNGASTQNISSLIPGNYHVVVTDANQCIAIKDISITEPEAINVSLDAVNPACGNTTNGRITVSATGGSGTFNYTWNNGSTDQNRSALSAGSYAVTVTDETNCSATAGATLVQASAIALSETHGNPNCTNPSGGNIHVTATGGTPSYDFRWNTGSNAAALTGLSAGNYSVTVSDAAGCQAFLNNIALIQPTAVQINTHTTDVTCAGADNGTVSLLLTGGTAPFTYSWDNGAQTQDISNIAGGTYTVTVTDAAGCSQTSTAVVQQGNGIHVSALVPTLACESQQGTIDITVDNGTAPYAFQWNNGAVTEDIHNASAGYYSLTVRDANNCLFDTSFVLAAVNPFNVTVAGGASINEGESVELSATTNGSANVSYNWLPVPGLSCTTCQTVTAQPGKTTMYTVVATDANGCVATDTVTVEVNDETNLFLPNAFTPNGDGNNDVLQLYGNISAIKYFQLLIFDRWGEKVFETNDASFNWDGTYRGEKLQSSVYLYVMKTVMLDGTTNRTFKGTITMLK